jgi:hypothetical protein
LFVDPGVGGTGVALWDVSCSRHPIAAFNVNSGSGTWLERQRHIVDRLTEQVPVYPPAQLIIECPEWQSGATGEACAKRGDLVKLAIITGAIVRAYRDWEIQFVTPSMWKGQLPKKLVHDEMLRSVMSKARMRKLGLVGKASHCWDAVAMGYWWLGGGK